jgi:hypothetical protein
MKPNKENIIQDILIELEKGTTYTECIGVIRSKSKLAESTFATYWNDANERYKDVLNKRQTILNEVSTDLEKERLKKAILTKDKALELLTKTAEGKARQVGKEVIIPTHSDSTNAIKTMADLLGWKTATEINLNTKEITTIKLPDGTEYEI